MSGEENNKKTTKGEGEGIKKTTKDDEGINEVKGEKQKPTGPTMSDEGATVTVGDTKYVFCVNPIRDIEKSETIMSENKQYIAPECAEFLIKNPGLDPIRDIEKWEAIMSENKQIYIAPECAEFLIKNPGLVARAPTLLGSKNVEGFWDLKVRRANLGGYYMSWELREENMWKDLRGKVWLKKRKAAE